PTSNRHHHPSSRCPESLPRAACYHHLLPLSPSSSSVAMAVPCASALTVDGDGWWISSVEVWIYHGSRGGARWWWISALTIDGNGGSEAEGRRQRSRGRRLGWVAARLGAAGWAAGLGAAPRPWRSSTMAVMALLDGRG
ncbi:hypothetical protein Dimus_024451, partial [Dionaea muscipula]